MQSKLVSIILPVYNAKRFLRLCLDSILRQSYEAWELIVVDDGSIDGSLEILESYTNKDSRIHVISKDNEGVSIARNVALTHAKGEYVYFVDADDVVMPDALAILVKAMEMPGATFVKSDFLPIDEDGKQVFVNKKQVIRRRYDGKVMDAETFYKKILMNEYFLWTCLFRRDIIEEHQIRFIPHCRLMEDAAFVVDYLQYSDRNVYKDACVYGYRKYEGTASEAKRDYSKDLEMILQCMSADKGTNVLNKLLRKQIKRIQLEYKTKVLNKILSMFYSKMERLNIYIKYQLS